MKIGLLTFHFSDNYGALLQAYALREWLKRSGFDANFVNYAPDYVEGGGNFSGLHRLKNAKANAKVLYLKLSNLRTKWFGSKVSKEAFDQFREKNLGVRSEEIKSADELERKKLVYDILICGSDQIWNPSEQFGVDRVYFLNFATECSRKISYAASFGSTDLKEEFRTAVASHLEKLDAISVREEGAVGLVERLTDRKAYCVPDPTFLLDDYAHLISPPPEVSTPYVFSYVLRSGSGFSEIAEVLKSRKSWDIISANNPHRRWRKIGREVFGGPIEWLSRLAGAELVLTNSFHATVFSILLNKPFIAVRLPGPKAKLSARLENLLSKVGLSERLVDAGDIKRAAELIDSTINWSGVNMEVSKLREIGRSYLAEQIPSK